MNNNPKSPTVLPISDLRLDPAAQVRAALDASVVKSYADVMHREEWVSKFFEPVYLGWQEFDPPADEPSLAEVA